MAIYQDNRGYVSRLGWIRILLITAILTLLGRLWYVSVIRYEQFSGLAERNHVRTIPLPAPRGIILDREGRILVENSYGFDLALFRDEDPDVEKTIRFLGAGLGLAEESLRERLADSRQQSVYRPVIIQENLSLKDIAYLMARRSEHPELEIFKSPRRVYPYGPLAAHLIGYVGEVSRRELESEEFARNRPGDLVGKYGIERTYNRRLTGIEGRQRVLVDSRGKSLGELVTEAPIEGEELTLTIDLDLQRAAEDALGEDEGAVVGLDPNNGEILVLASKPGFDPNSFVGRLSVAEWRELLENPQKPLQNRAIQGTFAPGSIFKLVVALAGLERGLVERRSSVFCNGSVTLYGHPFRCWNPYGHGRVTVVEAIQHSCNVYFYLLGQKLGIDQLAEFSRRLGLGEPTGVDLPGEAAGLVPSRAWKRRTTGHPWYPGETISVSIGQGPIDVTPIQLAQAVGTLSSGKVPSLHLVRDFAPVRLPTAAGEQTAFTPRNLEAVREGMWRGVNQHGTGFGARVEGLEVCGKTGTVQTIGRSTRAKLGRSRTAKHEPHAWFVGFAPCDDPQFVVAVLVQRGGSGGSSAAPIAGRLFHLFESKKQEFGGDPPQLTRRQPGPAAAETGGGR